MDFKERLKEIATGGAHSHIEDIRIHLEAPNNNPLSAEVTTSIVQPLWQEEPFRSRGFVLEGFPNSEEEVKLAASKGLFPDFVVVYSLEVETAIKRILPTSLAKFSREKQATSEQRAAKQARLKEAADVRKANWEEQQRLSRAEAKAKLRAEQGEEYESDGEDEDEEAE